MRCAGVQGRAVARSDERRAFILLIPRVATLMSDLARLQLVTEETVLPMPEPPRAWATGHDVQFYESEDFLADTVAAFLVDGVRAAQPILVIATAAHRKAFADRMRAARVSTDDLLAARDVVWLDARETLKAFMEGGQPSRELFFHTIGSVFAKMMDGRKYLVVRAYGEMVDLLWKDGNIEGAIAVEDLWNELAIKYSFSLLCAYSMGNFFKEAHTHSFQRICGQHAQVVPTEAYIKGDDSERLRQITLLQQRARALEAEIAHRKDMELALRETLAHRRRVEEQLRQSEQRLRDFLEQAPEGIHWVGPDGIIIWANQHELDMLGYAKNEYVGHHIAEFHVDGRVIGDMLGRLARLEELRDVQSTMLCRDGSHKRVLVSSNVAVEDGKFVHTRCFTRDISQIVS
jgi:PAS domain S-box-containing protein